MGVRNPDIVDFASINLNGDTVLTIADELEWDEKNEHLLMLQEKLNRYLAFIESGEIYEKYPEAIDKGFVISIIAKYSPNDIAKAFLERVKETLMHAGYGFGFKVLPGDEPKLFNQ